MKRVFLCHTPYHVLLSSLVCHHSNQESLLVVFSDFPESDFYKNWKYGDVSLLPGTQQTAGTVERLRQARENWMKIKEWSGFDDIYVFNDQRYEVSRFCSWQKKKYGSQVYCLEDGLAVYQEERPYRENWSSFFARSVILQDFWSRPLLMGTSTFIDKRWVMYPEHVFSGQAFALREQFPMDRGFRDDYTDFFRTTFASEFQKLEKVSDVFVLPLVAELNEEAKKELESVIRSVQSRVEPLVFKLHPRENVPLLPDFVSAHSQLSAVVPIEVFAMSGNLSSVWTPVSTSSLNLKWICPEIKCEVYSLLGARPDVRKVLEASKVDKVPGAQW